MLHDPKTLTPAPDHFGPPNILLICEIRDTGIYRAEILRRAGFLVKTITPAEASIVVTHAFGSYSVAVLNHTQRPEDVEGIALRIRQTSPWMKIVLMKGWESYDVDPSLYDLSIYALDGAEMLISVVDS
jgi:hypothetical protein